MADSEKYFTKTVDGQLSVATVAQSGEIIPEESRPGDKYTTALVQTDDGPQLCVKTFDLNGGGGGGGTVDQTYDPTSTNAQSGTAVAEAVAPALKNTATDSTSIVINNKNEVISSKKTTVIGNNASTTVGYAVVIGDSAEEKSPNAVGGIAIGQNSLSYGGVSIGMLAKNGLGVAIGQGYNANHFVEASATGSIAIGIVTSPSLADSVKANATNAIQLGNGINSNAKTFQVYTYQLLDGNTGKIPMARLPIVQCTQAEYDALVSGGTVDANTIYCIIPA